MNKKNNTSDQKQLINTQLEKQTNFSKAIPNPNSQKNKIQKLALL